MGSPLPVLSEAEFHQRIALSQPSASDASCLTALYSHFTELRRWNPHLSLIGPSSQENVIERHYGESLAALPLITPSDRQLLDVGSGAGFPGIVIAAARPALDVTLVESKERKWAFLRTVVHKCGLSCTCLNVRVSRPLPREIPREIDIVTSRALALSPGLLEGLCEFSPRVRFLLWCGATVPALPPRFSISRDLPLAGSKHRRILEIRTH